MGRSWRTSLGAIILAVSMISGELWKLFDDDPKTEPSVMVIIGAIGAAGAGMSARDNVVTSEQAGAKRP